MVGIWEPGPVRPQIVKSALRGHERCVVTLADQVLCIPPLDGRGQFVHAKWRETFNGDDLS